MRRVIDRVRQERRRESVYLQRRLDGQRKISRRAALENISKRARIDFVAVNLDYRGRGLGRRLYSTFFDTFGRLGCTVVRCITSPVNTGSIAFHGRMGFQVERATGEHQGVPCAVKCELN